MARTAAMRRQGLQRRSSRRNNVPKATAPSTGIPIIDVFASPLGHIWNKLAGGRAPAHNIPQVDSDNSTEPNSPYSSDDASSSNESLLDTPATTPPASSSLGPDDFASTNHSFSKAPGAFPTSFDPANSPQKATRAPPNSPAKPSKPKKDWSVRPNRYGLLETESLYYSLPDATEPVEKEPVNPFAPPPPTVRQLEETMIHDRESLTLVLNAMLEDQRMQTTRAAKFHATFDVKSAKYRRDRRAWHEHDGEANVRAMRRAKIRFGFAVRAQEENERVRLTGRGRARKFCMGAEKVRLGERELREAVRAAERYNFNFIRATGDARLAKKLRDKLMKQREGNLAYAAQQQQQQEKARAPAPPPPPPSPEKKSAPTPAPATERTTPSTPKKKPMPDLAKFPCFVKPGMFDEPSMAHPQPSPQPSPTRPKPFMFAKYPAQQTPTRPRTRPATHSRSKAGPSTPQRTKPQPRPQFTKPAKPVSTPSDEAEEERARQRQQQREQRYFGMEDVASFIRRRKWENTPQAGSPNGARDHFEGRPSPRPFSPMSSPSKPQPAKNDFPRQSADVPKFPKFNAAPKFSAPPPPPPPQPQPQTPLQRPAPTPIPVTPDDFRAQERFEAYDSLWASLLSTTSSLMDIELTFSAFPWPVLRCPKSVADIKQVDIEEFIFHRLRIPRSDADFFTRRKQAVKDALLRWHPDKFMSGRVLSRVVEEDREKVMEAAQVVGRILVELVGK